MYIRKSSLEAKLQLFTLQCNNNFEQQNINKTIVFPAQEKLKTSYNKKHFQSSKQFKLSHIKFHRDRRENNNRSYYQYSLSQKKKSRQPLSISKATIQIENMKSLNQISQLKKQNQHANPLSSLPKITLQCCQEFVKISKIKKFKITSTKYILPEFLKPRIAFKEKKI